MLASAVSSAARSVGDNFAARLSISWYCSAQQSALLTGMGRMALGQSPGAGDDGAGGTWPRRRSAGGIAHASVHFTVDLVAICLLVE